MVSILIKSFNRPFYLDRCLSSIYRFVEGDFEIKILDDGTPQKYLDKIKVKYPEADIRLSKNHSLKVKALAENLIDGTKIDGFIVPTELWIDAAKNATDYFIMTEDDVWFTKNIDINNLQYEAKKFQTGLIKLGWLGNQREDKDLNFFDLSRQLNAVQPKNLFLSHKGIMEAFFFNKFKFYSLLYKLGKVDHESRNKYWALNSILMGFYHKEYWLQIWKGMAGKVDEKRQLCNAAVYYKKQQRNPNFVARLKEEAMKTTFQSSATGSYHEYGFDFNVNTFNYLISEAWYNDGFNALENFPDDFSMSYFNSFITEKMQVDEFEKWVTQFKTQYKNLGAHVD